MVQIAPMELRHLHALVAVADELHFGRAAARVGISQPALSQQIAQLELLVGSKLCERSPRVALTLAGKFLTDHARRIIAMVTEAESEVRSLGTQARQRIRLGYLEYWNPPFLAAAMRELRERDPSIVVEPRNMYPHEVLAGLRDRTLELGFVHMPIADQALAVRLVLDGYWAFVLPRSHRLARRDSLALADLHDQPLIVFDRSVNPPLHAWLLGRFAEAKLVPRIVYSTTQPQVGIDLVREGVGLFIVGSYVVRSLPRDLVMRRVSDLPPLQIGAAWRGDERTPALAALLAALPKLRADGSPA
ncbi:MAG: LysR family transcriptional regulator [Kofleriaceae bacterium]|nr:LysR family transcriptional regulator [Kofleriaceae bacterium]